MNKFSKITLLIIFSFLFLLNSCYKAEEYPIEPHIEFVSFLTYANGTGEEFGSFKISFTDGDGDIGLSEEDTIYPYESGTKYYYNFFLDFYIKENGSFVPYEFPDTNFTYNSRIPLILNTEEPKAIRGEIDIEINISIIKAVLGGDTIMMEASIADRALHKSNTVQSYEIIF